MARVSARCRDGGETAFCAVRRSARGCVRRLSTRARSVCHSSGRGVAALFAYAQFLAAGFCESDPSCHAGAASPARGCSRAFLVSLDNARQFGSFRIWLGSRHRLRRLHCLECSWQDKARPCGGCLQFSGSLPQAFSQRRYRHDLCPIWHPAQIQQLRKGR